MFGLDPGFLLLMALSIGFTAVAAWRGFEQDKREEKERKGLQMTGADTSCTCARNCSVHGLASRSSSNLM